MQCWRCWRYATHPTEGEVRYTDSYIGCTSDMDVIDTCSRPDVRAKKGGI